MAELKHQVSLLKQRENKVSTENKELQHTILDLENRLSDIQDRNDNFSSYAMVSELHKRLAFHLSNIALE